MMKTRTTMGRLLLAGSGLAVLAACSADQTAQDDVGPRPGPSRETNDRDESVFGDDGFTLGGLASGDLFRSTTPGELENLPINRYLWQASLDTLSFLPLASTDPFTGVIATDWGTPPQSQGERFKVTSYMVSPELAASSLRVAVYREVRSEEGTWVPAAVDPNTARQLEDAILTRARQIRIAAVEGETTG